MKHIVQFLVGLIGGLVVPIFIGWIYIQNLYEGSMPPAELMNYLMITSLLTKILFIAILPNMLAVFLLNYLEQWMACRGVFVSIIIYIIIGIWTI